ncbi:MAG: thiamine pyrophosphate-dependent enzyme [Anaerolineales bacterium]|nr:thiamine pyrophosphate-dependent enzyme [Anaerolineales bacterium]
MIATEPHLRVHTETALRDYVLASESRHISLIGRREVMSGKAKFGIFGDGKELAQIALAKIIRPGDFRSGYYRDQTLAFALGVLTYEQWFAQLYAHADVAAEPMMGGRVMNGHYSTRSLTPNGAWRNLTAQVNFAPDVSPTASQMPRLVGLAYASRLYAELPELQALTQFSSRGEEIAIGTIGNASCAEGLFWESLNAIGVLRAPALIVIWDDGYGISVPNEYQFTKHNLGELLEGFRRAPGSKHGFDLFSVRGWDYPALLETFAAAERSVRGERVPAVVHVTELTQPQGHSTSGSHERYKPAERLEWEREYDCLRQFRHWLIEQGMATVEELDNLDKAARQTAEAARQRAWQAFNDPIRAEHRELAGLLDEIAPLTKHAAELQQIKQRLLSTPTPLRRDAQTAIRDALLVLKDAPRPAREPLIRWRNEHNRRARERYGSHLYSQSPESALNVPEVRARYSERSPEVHGFEVLNACFDAMLARDPRVLAFGEDVGRLGDVNQGFAGLQAKYGELRVSDTGIREATIIGQAIGLALRGLRPIAEIQYLDYLLYALQILSDDLACLHWRTAGGQKAPVIIRTRGHRLEGVWHSGSQMSAVLSLLRGIYVLVPRNMTQAAGFYNTLLLSDEPGLVVEVLNGYRLKERRPDNLAEFTIPLGVPEVLRPGHDVTLVTYGACCRLALEAAQLLAGVGIETEVIDVRSLLPFDRFGMIGESLRKTNRIVFVDEDVPGGATAYMLQEVLEKQGGYRYLDSPPRTLTAQPHRPAYGSDGDYWSKPNVEQIFEAVYDLMHESDPAAYPLFYR